MGRTIIKVDPGLDLYIEWSSIVEEPIMWGPRRFLELRGIDAQRLDRSDKQGSSSYHGFNFWDHDVLIYKQQGILRRANMSELLERLEQDAKADVSDLLDPFDDD